MRKQRLIQLVASLNPTDAVSDFARELADRARELGVVTRTVAARVHPRCAHEAMASATTSPEQAGGPSDVLLYHHSIGAGLVPWVARFPGRRIVVHHSITPSRYFESWAPRLAVSTARGVAELLELADLTASALGVSEFDAAEARAAGFRDVGVLPISPCRSRLSARPEHGFGRRSRIEPGRRILCLGRLAPNKRIEIVLAAHALVGRLEPGVRLDIVGGDGGTEGYALALRVLARELGAVGVCFHGAVDDRRLASLFAAASMLVSASEHEGCGLPLLEAMYHRVPVIARASAAVPETVASAGLLLDDDDPRAWASAIVSVLRDPAMRDRLVAAGRERVEARLRTDLRARLRALLGGAAASAA